MQNKYLVQMGRKIQKIRGWQKHEKAIVDMIVDINNFLKKISLPKLLQGLIGIEEIFRGYVVKQWTQDITDPTELYKCNKDKLISSVRINKNVVVPSNLNK